MRFLRERSQRLRRKEKFLDLAKEMERKRSEILMRKSRKWCLKFREVQERGRVNFMACFSEEDGH